MDYRKLYENWLADERLCEEGKLELENLQTNEKELEYRFGGQLEFGTAGMRGIIGYGVNMMNLHRDIDKRCAYPYHLLHF